MRIVWLLALAASVSTAQAEELPVVFETDFDSGSTAGWTFTEEAAWKFVEHGDGKALALTKRISDYKPKVRSPHNIALVDGVVVSTFQLDVDCRSTKDTGAHQDICIFFGYQGPSKFYYTHIAKQGEKSDDPGGVRANSIFVVNDEPRSSIATERVIGVPWGDTWHHVRVTGDAKTGEIAVYFDDMSNPIMKAVDKTFTWGQVGLGSFDDMGEYDNLVIRGVTAKQ